MWAPGPAARARGAAAKPSIPKQSEYCTRFANDGNDAPQGLHRFAKLRPSSLAKHRQHVRSRLRRAERVLELFEPADMAGDFLKTLAFIERVARLVGGQALKLHELAAGGFQMLDDAAEDLAAEPAALKTRANAEHIDVAEGRFAIDVGAGHRGEPAIRFPDKDDLCGEDFAQAIGPALTPIAAVEWTDCRVKILLPGDRLEAVDDEPFKWRVVFFRSKSEMKLHAVILAATGKQMHAGRVTIGPFNQKTITACQ